MNTTLEFSATVRVWVGTSTEPTYSYEYGADLYYDLSYGAYANILGGSWIWHFQPVSLYSGQGMKYTIYHNDNVESETTLNLKRDLGHSHLRNHHDHGHSHTHHHRRLVMEFDHGPLDELSELGVFDDGNDNDAEDIWHDGEIRPYKPLSLPPKQLRHDRRKTVGSNAWQHANATFHLPSAEPALYKRAGDDDIDMPDADTSSQFFNYQNFTCPARGTREPILPDFRCK